MWKKQYSIAAQTMNMIIADEGGIYFNGAGGARTTFSNYIKFLPVSSSDCFADRYNFYENTSASESSWWTVSAKSTDGSDWGFSAANSDCSPFCAQIYVDVNGGNKSPNMYGKDMFLFYIHRVDGKYVINPGGAGPSSSYGCANPSSGWDTSVGCSKEALLSKSPDDMP